MMQLLSAAAAGWHSRGITPVRPSCFLPCSQASLLTRLPLYTLLPLLVSLTSPSLSLSLTLSPFLSLSASQLPVPWQVSRIHTAQHTITGHGCRTAGHRLHFLAFRELTPSPVATFHYVYHCCRSRCRNGKTQVASLSSPLLPSAGGGVLPSAGEWWWKVQQAKRGGTVRQFIEGRRRRNRVGTSESADVQCGEPVPLLVNVPSTGPLFWRSSAALAAPTSSPLTRQQLPWRRRRQHGVVVGEGQK